MKLTPAHHEFLRRAGATALCVLALSNTTACVNVDGGAVEANWVLRTLDGRAITTCSCSSPRVDRVRIDLTGTGTGNLGIRPCEGRTDCEFPCENGSGSTPFRVPPGAYAITVIPIDEDGRDLTRIATSALPAKIPAPILRDVVHGRATPTDAVSIQVGCATACSGADNTRVCATP